MEERLRSLYDVTKGFTLRRDVFLYCDVILRDITIMRGVSSVLWFHTLESYLVVIYSSE
jgi:hypothetical protein